MAGFAIVMTALTYGVIALVLTSAASFGFYLYAERRVSAGQHSVLRRLTAFPFIAILWLVVALILHVQISNRLAHQDCGFSPDPFVTLPNGYELGSLNTQDGYISAPGFKTGVPVAGPGYVRSIIKIQYLAPYFTGTQFDFDTSKVRRFSFDTKTMSFQTSEFIDSWSAVPTGPYSNETSYWNLYAKYRHSWPNYVLAILLIGGEGTIIAWAIGHLKSL